MRTFAALALSALSVPALILAASPAAARETVVYRPPVDAPVVDPFRPPATPYSAGNRGIDYETSSGDLVWAPAPGVVTFAGAVAGANHVVVLHGDGLRTSLSFLDAVLVAEGDRVGAGEPIGVAGGRVHFGVRSGTEYIDPLALLAGDGGAVRLIPISGEQPAPDEPGVLRRLVATLGRATVAVGRTGIEWARTGAEQAVRTAMRRVDALHAWADVAASLGIPMTVRLAAAAVEWYERRDECTSADEPAPRPRERRLAVLVGGLGSSGPDGAAVFDFDTSGAGYAAGDVTRFSYTGGDARSRPYDPADTLAPIDRSAARLRELVADIAVRHPGVPIDLIAHSQGGLVARAALTSDLSDPLPVSTLVTLGTPHDGASLATAAALARTSHAGTSALAAAGPVVERFSSVDLASPALRDLAEGSEFIRSLARRPLPRSTRVVSVAARHDLVVPPPDCYLPGAENVVVSVGGPHEALSAHDALPRSPQAVREVRLALAGLAATCRDLADALVDAFVGHGVEQVEDAVAAVLGAAP